MGPRVPDDQLDVGLCANQGAGSYAGLLSPRRAQGSSLSLVGEETVSLTQSGPSRSRTCCRHFLLAQLGDGRHVVLGEDSAHAQLQDLLQHYTACPLSPYGEMLTQPLARQVSPYPKSTTEDNVVAATSSIPAGSRLLDLPFSS